MSRKNLKKRRDSGYRIVRLVNGERLIAKISGSNSKKLYLERPMSIKGIISTDPVNPISIVKKEFLILSNWIDFCKSTTVGIPRQFILTISDADKFIEEAYNAQKNHEDVFDELDEDNLSTIFDSLEYGGNDSEVSSIVQDIINNIIENFHMTHEEEWDEESVNKDRKDYGNSYNDWSPYLKDYFPSNNNDDDRPQGQFN